MMMVIDFRAGLRAAGGDWLLPVKADFRMVAIAK
jgi:hypothetical protein